MASAWMNKIWAVLDKVHVALYRMSGGKFANKVANLPVLLITSSGRKTGKPRTKAIVYVKDGQDYLVHPTRQVVMTSVRTGTSI